MSGTMLTHNAQLVLFQSKSPQVRISSLSEIDQAVCKALDCRSAVFRVWMSPAMIFLLEE